MTVIASRFHYLTRASTTAATAGETQHGVEFRWVDAGSYTRNDRRRIVSMVVFGVRALISALRTRPRPDIIIGSSPQLLAALAASVAARLLRVPFVFEVRDVWPSVLVDLGAIRKGGLSHRILTWVERHLYRHAARVIVVPPGAGRRLEELGEDSTKCVHIPNAASIGSPPDDPPATLTAMLDAAVGRSIVMYLGAHGVSNDLQTVLDAVDRIRSIDPVAYERLAVVLVGDGSEKPALEASARRRHLERVAFHPPIPKHSVASVLRRADLLLVCFADAPTYDYGLSPNKLFDYMAVGRPILMASRSSTTVLHEHRAGYVYVPGDPIDLAARMIDVLALPVDQREALGQRARDAAAAHYSIGVTGELLERTLRNVLESRQSQTM